MTEIRSAGTQLLDLAAEMRPDWDPDDLRGALASAAGNGWPWPKAFLAAARLLCDPGAGPRDLLAETKHPLKPTAGVPTPATAEFTAAREALAAQAATGPGGDR